MNKEMASEVAMMTDDDLRHAANRATYYEAAMAEIKRRASVAAQPQPQISDDAYHIVKCAREDAREASGRIIKHLWIIFVLLPIVFGILFVILNAK